MFHSKDKPLPYTNAHATIQLIVMATEHVTTTDLFETQLQGFYPTVFIDYVFYNFMTPTLKPHNFVAKARFLTNLVRFERSRTGLFNGTKFVKNGTM